MKEEQVIRAKGILDGARTLQDAQEMVAAFGVYLNDLIEDGWELTHPIEDDYGYVEQRTMR